MSVAFSSTILLFATIVKAESATVSADKAVVVEGGVATAVDDSPATVITTDEVGNDKNIAYDGSDLIEWITSNGGFIHPNARIGLDPTGNYRGVFVKSVGGEEGGTEEGILEDELICSIPW
jgi:outer membrane receptor for ferrienterochelin and colicin